MIDIQALAPGLAGAPQPGRASRLALGTVQLGQRYGIANKGERPGLMESQAIVAAAREGGIDTLDTAEAYGEAEEVLGTAGVEGFRVVTKVSAVPDEVDDVSGWMRSAVEGSLTRLGLTHLSGLMLHAPDQLLGPRGSEISEALDSLRRSGLTERTGFSIYGVDKLPDLLAVHQPDLVQAPFNLVDRGLISSGWAARLKAEGVELHSRSSFLQGLLLMEPADRPPQFAQFSAVWAAYDSWLAETGLSPTEACLRFTMSEPLIDRVVVGVDSVAQLQSLLAVPETPLPSLPDMPATPDPLLINPAKWSRS